MGENLGLFIFPIWAPKISDYAQGGRSDWDLFSFLKTSSQFRSWIYSLINVEYKGSVLVQCNLSLDFLPKHLYYAVIDFEPLPKDFKAQHHTIKRPEIQTDIYLLRKISTKSPDELDKRERKKSLKIIKPDGVNTSDFDGTFSAFIPRWKLRCSPWDTARPRHFYGQIYFFGTLKFVATAYFVSSASHLRGQNDK